MHKDTLLNDLWNKFGGANIRPDFRFDAKFYCEIYSDIADAENDAGEHYLSHGEKEGRIPNKFGLLKKQSIDRLDEKIRQLITDKELIGLFESGYSEAAELAYELMVLGEPIDRKISNFSSQHYQITYSDIAEAKIIPIQHFLQSGLSEGRKTIEQVRSGINYGDVTYDRSKRTVLICAHELTRSGAPIVALNLAKEASSEHNVIVMALKGGQLLNEFLSVCTSVILTSTPFEDWDYFGLEELEDVDFAILNSVETYLFIKPLVAKSIPITGYIHEFSEYILPIYKATHFALYSEHIFFSSSIVRDSWAGLLEDINFDILNNTTLIAQEEYRFKPLSVRKCADARSRLTEALGIDCRHRKIVYGAGHAQIRKGTDLFVMAAQKTYEIDPEIIFIWIGDGVNHEDISFGVWLDKHFREANVNDPEGNIFAIPAGPLYRDVSEAADVLFLSSRLDPLPNVVFDAARYGCSTVLFRGATGFDADVYLNLPSIVRVDYGNLLDACHAILRSPRKYSRERYLSLDVSFKDETHVNNFSVFKTISKKVNVSESSSKLAELPKIPKNGVSVLYRGNDDSSYMMAKRRERALLKRLNRNAIWQDAATAQSVINENGGWMHKGTLVERLEDIPVGSVDISNIPPFNVHIHAHYLDDLEKDLNERVIYSLADRIIVTTDTDSKAAKIIEISAAVGYNINPCILPNQGRDILPFLRVVSTERNADDKIWCHVHQKKSVNSTLGGDLWRNFLLRHILGDHQSISSAIMRANEDQVGLVTAFDPYIVGWSGCRRLLSDAERRLGHSLPGTPLLFPVGNMFWTRASVAREMLNLFGEKYPWPNEPLPNDGTVYHLIERLWPAVVARLNKKSIFLELPHEKRA